MESRGRAPISHRSLPLEAKGYTLRCKNLSVFVHREEKNVGVNTSSPTGPDMAILRQQSPLDGISLQKAVAARRKRETLKRERKFTNCLKKS